MATYIVGDIHGCYQELQLLLQKVSFCEQHDCLWVCGDTVGRGPDALAVLRFLKNLPHCKMVLGNHDISLLALHAGALHPTKDRGIQAILAADDCETLIHWLQQQPLLYIDPTLNWGMVHAGIPPQWSIKQAQSYANIASQALQQQDPGSSRQILQQLFKLQTSSWQDNMSEANKICYTVNALTRMRVVDATGNIQLNYPRKNLNARPNDDPYLPWFAQPTLDLNNTHLCFGHWAALNGECPHPQIEALDTGCVWGKRLTLIRVNDQQRFSVDSIQPPRST